MKEAVINRIEERLRTLKLSQRDLVKKLGVNEVTVSRWLSGDRNPSSKTISEIATA